MCLKSILMLFIALLCLAIVAHNQLLGVGHTIALDIVLAGIAAACLASVREFWSAK